MKIKKRQLMDYANAINEVADVRGFSNNQLVALLENIKKLNKLHYDYMTEVTPEINGAWADLDKEMREKGEEFYQANKQELDTFNYRNGAQGGVKIPPSLEDTWAKLVAEVDAKYPEGVKMRAEHTEKAILIGEEEVDVEFIKMKGTANMNLKEFDKLQFMI